MKKLLLVYSLFALLFNLLTSCAASSQLAKATSPTATPGPANLAALRQYLGRNPNEEKFLEAGPLNSRLKSLLGNRHKAFLTCLQTVGPLSEEKGVLYLVGNKPQSSGTEAAAIVLDPKTDAIFIWMMVKGKTEEFKEGKKEILLPRDVLATMTNTKSK